MFLTTYQLAMLYIFNENSRLKRAKKIFWFVILARSCLEW